MAEVEPIRFHDLRHTHVAISIKSEESLKSISHQIGHSSIEHTAGTYGQILPGVGETAIAKFDDHFRSYEDTSNTNVSKMVATDPLVQK